MVDADKRFKSPPYPYCDLEAALDKAKALAEVARGFGVPLQTVARAWNFSATSSSTIKVLGALNQYGLLSDEGTGEAKRYRLSKLAEQVILDQRPNSEDRRLALQTAALSPKVFMDLWTRYQTAIVDETTIVYDLTLGLKHAGRAPYSEVAAKEIAQRFKATMAFAGVGVQSDQSDPQVLMDNDHAQQKNESAYGESEPRRSDALDRTPSDFVSRSSNTHLDEAQFEERKELDEGTAILIWPKHLSSESVEDLEYWLEGVLRSVRRRASKRVQP